MLNSAIELINLTAGINYAPTFISTDKRRPAGMPTSLGYYQIGEVQQYGYAKGPIFKIEFVDITNLSTATHLKIWGLDNVNDDVPIYSFEYVKAKTLEIYLKKFIFCDSAGVEVEEELNSYLVVGHKKKVMPFNW